MLTRVQNETGDEADEDLHAARKTSPLQRECDRFCRSLRAENKSPMTIKSYQEAVLILDGFLADKGMPQTLDGITGEHIGAFIEDQLARWKPATALNRYRSLTVFWNWIVAEGELRASPMYRMHPPHVEPDPPAVLSEKRVIALFKACEGAGFRERRDMALLRLLLDTGIRREELARVLLAEVDADEQTILIKAKGSRTRLVHYNRKAARDLDRYLRVRERHADAALPSLWLGVTGRGQVTGSGIYQILEYRALKAGVGHVKPHQFRHSFAHYFLEGGGQEGDLMRLAGWKSAEMAKRYGANLADQRAPGA